jgi:hypothetical protein
MEAGESIYGRREAGWRVTMGHRAERLAGGKGGKVEGSWKERGRMENRWKEGGRVADRKADGYVAKYKKRVA